MRRVIIILMMTIGTLAMAAVILLQSNKFTVTDGPLDYTQVDTQNSLHELPDTFSITTWNLGYAGLGAESEFFADGGKRLFPVSKAHVEQHTANIKRFLVQDSSPLKILQEVASKSHLIYEQDLYVAVRDALPGFGHAYSPSINIRYIPVIRRLLTGNAVFSRITPVSVERYALPVERSISPLSIQYNFILMRFAIAGSSKHWSVINLHFSAFDKGGILRKKQIEKLFNILRNEYEKGNYVIAGGDWNHRLVQTSFPNNTKEKYLFWIHDLPPEATLEGWKWGTDTTAPTVRTLERPYHHNENYTCIIDGFIVSPNVDIVKVSTTDLDFADSDHNPVTITVRRSIQ